MGRKIVVAFCPSGRKNVRKCPQRRERQIVLIESNSGFQQFAAGKIVLVFDAGDVNGFDIRWGCGNRILGRQTRVRIVEVVNQEARRQDIARAEVSLNFCEVAHSPYRVGFGAAGQ